MNTTFASNACVAMTRAISSTAVTPEAWSLAPGASHVAFDVLPQRESSWPLT
jgi:hypothetical protein